MTEEEYKECLDRAIEEISFWREEFLGRYDTNHHKTLRVYFQAIPSDQMVSRGPYICYRDSVNAYFQHLEDREKK